MAEVLQASYQSAFKKGIVKDSHMFELYVFA